MKPLFLLSAVVFPFLLTAQINVLNEPDFLSSRSTAGIYADNLNDFKHLLKKRMWYFSKRNFELIDSGIINTVEYSYYLSPDHTLIYAIPEVLPNLYYVISVCAYFSQGRGWSKDQIRAVQDEIPCW